MHDLVTVRRVGRHERTFRAGTVLCEAPQLDRLDAGPGQRLFDLRLAFHLTPRSPRARFVAVFIRVRLDDSRVRAVRLEADGVDPVSAEGLGECQFGWFSGSFDRRNDQGTSFSVKAVIEVPWDVNVITGAARVDASFGGRLRTRIDHAAMRDALALELRPRQAAQVSAVRLCLAVAVDMPSRSRPPEAAALVQDLLARVVREAHRCAGIDATQIGLALSGDGQLALLPPAIDESRVIPQLIQGLADALTAINADRAEQDRIRARVALDRGHVAWTAGTWAGDPPLSVQRMIDCGAMRQALADDRGSDFALIVSDVVYRDVIAHGYGDLSARDFRMAQVRVLAQDYAELAWIFVQRTAASS